MIQGNETAVQRDAVIDRRHGELTHTVMQVKALLSSSTSEWLLPPRAETG